MIVIPLQAIPNQTLSIQLDRNNVDIEIRACGNTMAFSLSINENIILTNERMVPAWPLIAYEYLENGNFYMLTDNDDYPDYNLFSVNQYLIYASQIELEALRNGLNN